MSTVSHINDTYFSDNNTRFVFIDGSACDHIDKCYDSLQQQLSIPEYFGKNLDALEEVLADLEWIDEAKIKIIILNESALFKNSDAKKKDFLEVLNSSENEKLEIIYLGDNA
jgi:RNAse (barnase) inhibitor barstar